jgi:hypothetical protein
MPDGEGGYTTPIAVLVPAAWHCSIARASARELERIAAGTVVASATHILEGYHHPGITRETVIGFEGRTFHVNDVIDPLERHIHTIAICQELILARPRGFQPGAFQPSGFQGG